MFDNERLIKLEAELATVRFLYKNSLIERARMREEVRTLNLALAKLGKLHSESVEECCTERHLRETAEQERDSYKARITPKGEK